MPNKYGKLTLCPPPNNKGLRLSSAHHGVSRATSCFLEQANSSRRRDGKLPLTQRDLKYLALRCPPLR